MTEQERTITPMPMPISMKMTSEQALFLLECMRGVYEDGSLPALAERKAVLPAADYESLAFGLAEIADVDRERLDWVTNW